MGLGQRALQINNFHLSFFFCQNNCLLGGRTRKPNGPKELSFQLIKVKVALESGNIHPVKGLQPEKELRSLSARTERNLPAGSRAEAEQPEDVLTHHKAQLLLKTSPSLQKPQGWNLPSENNSVSCHLGWVHQLCMILLSSRIHLGTSAENVSYEKHFWRW